MRHLSASLDDTYICSYFGVIIIRTKIDKVYCLGLHHFTNENTICLCRKSIDVLGLRIVSEHYRKERDSWKADCWLGSTYANIVQAVKKCYKQNFDSGVYGSVFHM